MAVIDELLRSPFHRLTTSAACPRTRESLAACRRAKRAVGGKFWEMEGGFLAYWAKEIQQGGQPNFGRTLRY